MKKAPHYNGRFGYYLPMPHDEIKLFDRTSLLDYLKKMGLSELDVVDEARGDK